MSIVLRSLLLLLTPFLFLGTAASSVAKEPLTIVADPWPPYTIADNEAVSGTDVEIIKAVFLQLDIPIDIKIFPWARCLALVENKQADAILDVSVNSERQTFLHFPIEPVSVGLTVFFVRKDAHLPFDNLASLNESRAGAIRGYSYCPEIDNAPFMARAERVSTLDQIFNMLLLKRIDFLIEVDAVGYYVAKKMGISDQVTTIPGAEYCHGGNYLAFSKKPGHEQLATRFGDALRTFKKTDSYRQILKKYGDAGNSTPASDSAL